MTRLLILATIILSIISFASAQIVQTLNTPIGPITQGANVPVTWTLVQGVDATGKNGQLTAQDSNTKNTITIDSAVPLAPGSFNWAVNVTPSTYTLGLNDGSGVKQSGPVTIVAAGPSASPAPGASSPASGPAASGPAASGPAASAPAASAPAASTPAASTPTASTPAAGTPKTPAATSTTGSSASSSSSSSSATPNGSNKSTSSASSIFSGYDVIFSLFGVAIAMIQF